MKTKFPDEIAPAVAKCDGIRRHKLLTAEIEKAMPRLRAQEKKGDEAVVYLKWFHPMSGWTWYITEYDPEERLAFGWVRGHEDEWGYISLDEIATTVARGLPIERDLYFTPCTIGEIKSGAKR